MYKLIYWSKKKKAIQVVLFSVPDDLIEFMANKFDDMDQVEHFVKVVKE